MTTWIEIPTAGGHVVLMPTTCAHQGYVRALAAAATIRLDHPCIAEPDDALVAVVADTWGHIAPGWASDDVRGIMAHYGLAHLLRMVGALALSPVRIAAYRKIVDAGTGEMVVLSYLGHSEFPSNHVLLDLILADGSCVVAASPSVDTDTLDDTEEEAVDAVPFPCRGGDIAQAVLGSA